MVFSLDSLAIPIMSAPMAGGPSTPELAAAVSSAGGLGFLAAGYKSAVAMREDIASVRALTDAPFGINLFVPDSANTSSPSPRPDVSADVARYREALLPEAWRYGVELPEPNPADTDDWEAKLEVLADTHVAVVSFTFGLPDTGVISLLQDAGSMVLITVTDPGEAGAALALGPDGLCVQGPLAGGHRGTHRVDSTPSELPLPDLLRAIRQLTDLPLVGAGGITRAGHIAEALSAGANAVQPGTVFLRAPESGANAVYKAALASDDFAGTVLTRAFSGRIARGLDNGFIRNYGDRAPAAYPEVNQLTRPLRAAATAAGNPDGLSLWAGARHRDTSTESAGAIVIRLWDDYRALTEGA